MLKQKIKVKIKNAEEIKNSYFHFGYQLVSEIPSGNKVILNFQKMPTTSSKSLKKLERQYKKVLKKFPLAATIFLLVGLIFLFVGLFLNVGIQIINIVLLVVASLLFVDAVYLYIGFLLNFIYRKKTLANIFKKAQKIYPEGSIQLPNNFNTINN